jgi:hypothetical protein
MFQRKFPSETPWLIPTQGRSTFDVSKISSERSSWRAHES